MPLYIARGNDSGAGEERTPLWWSPLYLDHLAVVFFFEDVRYSRSGLLPFIVLCVCMCVCSQWVKVLVSQSCLTLWDPMDCSLPGPSILGILQARLLEWVAIPFSRGSSLPQDRTWVSCISGRLFTIWATRENWWLIPKFKTLLSSPWSCRVSSQREESSLLVSFRNFTHFPPVRRGRS